MNAGKALWYLQVSSPSLWDASRQLELFWEGLVRYDLHKIKKLVALTRLFDKILHAADKNLLKIVVQAVVIINWPANLVGEVIMSLLMTWQSHLLDERLGLLFIYGLEVGLAEVCPKSSWPKATAAWL